MVAFNFDSFYLAFLKYRGSRHHDRFSEAQTILERVKVSRAMINDTVIKADARRELLK